MPNQQKATSDSPTPLAKVCGDNPPSVDMEEIDSYDCRYMLFCAQSILTVIEKTLGCIPQPFLFLLLLGMVAVMAYAIISSTALPLIILCSLVVAALAVANGQSCGFMVDESSRHVPTPA